MQEIISQITKEIKKDLLPKLKLFKNFKITKIYRGDEVYLGYYKYNSYEEPIIKLNIPEIKECISDKAPLDLIIETTILHELGHAIQEYKGKEFDEEKAEDFAYNYYYERIIRIWKNINMALVFLKVSKSIIN